MHKKIPHRPPEVAEWCAEIALAEPGVLAPSRCLVLKGRKYNWRDWERNLDVESYVFRKVKSGFEFQSKKERKENECCFPSSPEISLI